MNSDDATDVAQAIDASISGTAGAREFCNCRPFWRRWPNGDQAAKRFGQSHTETRFVPPNAFRSGPRLINMQTYTDRRYAGILPNHEYKDAEC